ncbi:hypothetical protein [Fuscovulum blasticum]|uniref:hypothetical protein n=1 Tax=Fuscovulum blasticum TaxID=1075 RepID=UPI000D3E0984|nr:hypothetical protein [Fuscovulum blasticum]AWD20308.1 hypothetical protein B6K69_00455 [Fuscovulum blasticum]
MTTALHTAAGTGPLRCRSAAAGLMAVALAGCVAPQDELDRVGAAKAVPLAEVVVDGRAFAVQVEGRGTGLRLTADGARPVEGRLVRVAASASPLAMDEGAIAKKAARQGCGKAGGRFNEAAIGAYERSGAAWVFAGACA